MRLTTWNVAGKPERCWPTLGGIDPEIAVLQEVPWGWVPPDPHASLHLRPTSSPRRAFGAVAIGAGWHLADLHDGSDPLPWTVPLRVVGPTREFLLIAIWARSDLPAQSSYSTQLAQVIERYGPLNEPEDLVIAGDINDSAHQSTGARYLRNVERLREYGLVSAYHATQALPDAAKVPTTLSWAGDQSLAFHCDVIFIPDRWLVAQPSVTLGDPHVVFDTGMSDHLPVTLEIADPA